ncbi:MAG: PIN domain-containing protein [Nitrospirae bacterium]|nr:PIN domain-containing protein [Nitrospirota bacterium]
MKKSVKSLPDTNAIVRYLVRDDIALYERARDYFDKVKNGTTKTIILESVVAECIYVLTKIYKVPRNKAAGGLIDILHYKGVANDDRTDLIGALAIFAEQDIDIVDCILSVKSDSFDAHLFSFDQELNKIHSGRKPKVSDR